MLIVFCFYRKFTAKVCTVPENAKCEECKLSRGRIDGVLEACGRVCEEKEKRQWPLVISCEQEEEARQGLAFFLQK